MAKTLLVVDDSATMRKVFQLTFGGEGVTIVAHDGSDGVVAKAREAKPAVAIVDVNLGGPSAYDICRAIKSDPALRETRVLMLYSEQSPLDEAKAREAGSDGSLLKPFDTQATIDKLKPLWGDKPGAPIAPPGATAPRPATAQEPPGTRPTTAIHAAPPPPGPARPPPGPQTNAPKATQTFAPAVVSTVSVDSDNDVVVDLEPEDERPAPAAAPAPKPHAPTGAATAAAQTISSEVAQRAQSLGLTPAQVDAIATLTREVVERVVWEVVPQLAESMIREEIRRLTE